MAYNLKINGKIYENVEKIIVGSAEEGTEQELEFKVPVLGEISVDSNETLQELLASDYNLDGFSKIIKNPLSSTYVGSGITRKAAQTFTPSRTTQTISANQFLTGNQTISPIPNEYLIPNDDISITDNGTTIDIAKYATASVNVKHFASGNKSLSAGQDPVTVSGITDQNGKSFTPVGFCFMLHPTKPTNFVGSTYYLVSAVYHNRECSRIVAWNQNASNATAYYSVRANPSVPSIGSSGVTLSNGKFSLHVGSDAYKPIAGRYMWVAWG